MPSRTCKTGLTVGVALIVSGLVPATTWASPAPEAPATETTATTDQATPDRAPAATSGTASTPSTPAAPGTTQTSDDASPATSGGAAHLPSTWFGTNVVGGALQSKQQTYGRLGIGRVFFPGLPQSWSQLQSKAGDTRLVVSFRAQPADVLSGRYDQQLRQWFADAPRDHATRWTYWHEPENDRALQLTAYRAAWRHIEELSRSAGNPKLRATLILMCWTLHPHSGRDWRDYYPGSDTIDVLAFDCYSSFGGGNRYREPENLFGPVYQLAQQLGKPFGIAELGTNRIAGDDGQGRARWIERSAEWLKQHDARFVSYFDNGRMALNDPWSQSAWRNIVTGQWR